MTREEMMFFLNPADFFLNLFRSSDGNVSFSKEKLDFLDKNISKLSESDFLDFFFYATGMYDDDSRKQIVELNGKENEKDEKKFLLIIDKELSNRTYEKRFLEEGKKKSFTMPGKPSLDKYFMMAVLCAENISRNDLPKEAKNDRERLDGIKRKILPKIFSREHIRKLLSSQEPENGNKLENNVLSAISISLDKDSYIDKDGSPRQFLFDISEYGILPASIEMLNIKDKKFIFSSRLNDGEPTLAEIFIESCKKDENKFIKLVDDIFFDEDILSIPICGNSTTNKDLFCLADLIYLESTSSKSIEIDMDAFSRAVVSSKKVRNMVNPVFLEELEKRAKKSSSGWNDDRGDIFLR